MLPPGTAAGASAFPSEPVGSKASLVGPQTVLQRDTGLTKAGGLLICVVGLARRRSLRVTSVI